jgi:acyl-CoA hydrolase
MRRNGFARVMDIVARGNANHHLTLFAGHGLALLSKAAFIAAARHGRRNFVMASCERMDFPAPARMGEILEARGRVMRVGTRSVGVSLELFAENPASGTRRRCIAGQCTMVATREGPHADAPLPPPGDDGEDEGDEPFRISDLAFPGLADAGGRIGEDALRAAAARAAAICASRHFGMPPATPECQDFELAAPVAVGEIFDLVPRMAAAPAGLVAVELWAEALTSEERRLCGRGDFLVDARSASRPG